MPGLLNKFMLARFEGRAFDPLDTRVYKKDNEAPPPDPNIGRAALRQAELGENYLKMMQQQYDDSKPMQDRMNQMGLDVSSQQMRIADESERRASDNFARYREKFVPVEDQFLQEAKDAGSVQDQDRAQNQAVAGMNREAAMQRQATDRNMMSMGVNPNSGRFAGQARANELMAMARTAGAGNMAREGARSQGMQMRASASNLGRGMMADTTAAGGLALQGGQGALSANGAGFGMMNARGQMLGQGYQGAMAGQAGMATGLGNLYNAQVNQAVSRNNAQGAAVAGMAQGVGMAAGMAMSDPLAKENVVRIGMLANGLNLYAFDYKPQFKDEHGHGRFFGVMADEVEDLIPEAVGVGADGYKRVDYAMLGV